MKNMEILNRQLHFLSLAFFSPFYSFVFTPKKRGGKFGLFSLSKYTNKPTTATLRLQQLQLQIATSVLIRFGVVQVQFLHLLQVLDQLLRMLYRLN